MRMALRLVVGSCCAWAARGEEAVMMLQRARREDLDMKGATKSDVRASEGLENLLDNAKGLLTNGAAPEMLRFTEETLRTLKADLEPAIQRDHKEQMDMVMGHMNSISEFLSHHKQALEDLKAQYAAQAEESNKAKACRTGEVVIQGKGTSCEDELARLWELVQELEDDLDNIDGTITTRWCVPGVNTSDNSFREESSTHFDKYSAKRVKVREAWKAYLDFLPTCSSDQVDITERVGQCDQFQSDLEARACANAQAAAHTAMGAESLWPTLSNVYATTVEAVKVSMDARKHELATLRTVECLLDKIHGLGGRPCQEVETEVPGAAQKEIDACHEQSTDTSGLDIALAPLPEAPEAPEARPAPCSDEWWAAEYADLTAQGLNVAKCRPCQSAAPLLKESNKVVVPQVKR